MDETAEILEVVGLIYDAACDPAGWNTVLERITKLTGSSSAALVFRDNTYPRSNFVYAHGISMKVTREYMQRYIYLDPFFKLLVKDLPRGTVSADHLLLPDRQALREQNVEFYDDFMIPSDIYHIGGAGLLIDGDQMGAVAIQRRQALGPWSDEELEKLGMLTDHLQRALHIHREFTRLRTHEYAAYAMFDQLIIGLVLLNTSHQITYANPTAQSILGTHPALKIRNQRIFAAELEDRKRVNTLIQETITGREDDNESMHGGVLGLRHPDCSYPLLLLSMPVTELRNALGSTIDSASVALFISDPERTQPISPDALIETFDLTHAEAAVTIALANGLSPKEIAQSKNVSTDTVRSQLKAIFRKTGANSQVELVRLLLTGPFGTFCTRDT